MKSFYIVVTVEENKKYYSYVIIVYESENLVRKLNIPNITHANLFHSKKRAKEVAQSWNDSYKANGTYMFDNPKF